MATTVEAFETDTLAPEAPDAYENLFGQIEVEDECVDLVGLLAEYDTVDGVVAAAQAVRAAGFRRWDVHTPFPIHGIDDVIGIRPTILPWIVLGGGLTGLAGGTFLTVWTMATNFHWFGAVQGYQFMISGKPYLSLPAFIPPIFELTILLSAFGAVFGMLLLNALPMFYNPLFRSQRFRRATNDRFFIVIDASDRKFDEQGTETLLNGTHALAVERIED